MENICHHKRLPEAETSGQKVGETLKIPSSPFKMAALFVNTDGKLCIKLAALPLMSAGISF